LRHAADRTGAETDQRVGGIVGVALEIALQPAVLSRDGQAVAREGKMIEPDSDVAGAGFEATCVRDPFNAMFFSVMFLLQTLRL
jgi:hypothetical protein